MARPKPPGAVRRGGHLVRPASGTSLTLAEVQARRPQGINEDPDARSAWDTYAAQLAGVAQISETDLAALELLCYAYSDLLATRRAIREHGRTYTETTAGGTETLKARPEVQMASDAARRHKALLQELGMTPGTRGKVERDVPPDRREADPWDEVGDVPPTPEQPAGK